MLPAGADFSGMTVNLITPDVNGEASERVLAWQREGDAIVFTVPEVRCYALVTLGR